MNNVKIGEITILYGIYFAELLSLELLSFAKYYFKLIHFCGVLFSLTLAYFSFVHADLVSRIVSANSEVFFFFFFEVLLFIYIWLYIFFEDYEAKSFEKSWPGQSVNLDSFSFKMLHLCYEMKLFWRVSQFFSIVKFCFASCILLNKRHARVVFVFNSLRPIWNGNKIYIFHMTIHLISFLPFMFVMMSGFTNFANFKWFYFHGNWAQKTLNICLIGSNIGCSASKAAVRRYSSM